jgi:hypothetical protein
MNPRTLCPVETTITITPPRTSNSDEARGFLCGNVKSRMDVTAVLNNITNLKMLHLPLSP